VATGAMCAASVPRVDGVATAAGTWALNDVEARYIEASVNADEAWEKAMEEQAGLDYTSPVQPPGLARQVGFLDRQGRPGGGAEGGVLHGQHHRLSTAFARSEPVAFGQVVCVQLKSLESNHAGHVPPAALRWHPSVSAVHRLCAAACRTAPASCVIM